MRRACMRSCGLCDGAAAAEAGAAIAEAAVGAGAVAGAVGAVGAPCIDFNPHCVGWAEVGECARSPQVMERSCPLSCGVCVDGAEVSAVVRPARIGAMITPLECLGLRPSSGEPPALGRWRGGDGGGCSPLPRLASGMCGLGGGG
jgi:hypothetical protein